MKRLDAPATLHAELVQLGARWLKSQGFSVVATELVAAGSREQPDVIGFRSTCSAVIEAKASRADFIADAGKIHRADGNGLGLYRFYICPPGLIRPEELPMRWGLLYAERHTVTPILKPPGNIWPPAGHGPDPWQLFQHEFNANGERSALFSIARRLSQSGPHPANAN